MNLCFIPNIKSNTKTMVYKRNLFEKLYIKFAVWLQFLKKELLTGGNSFYPRTLLLFVKGFYSKRNIPYDLNRWGYKSYISDLEQLKLTYINYPYSKLLRNKYAFSVFFKDYFKTTDTFCLIDKNRIFPVNKDQYINDTKSLLHLLEKRNKLILKPNMGSRGQGIYLMESKDKNILINGRILNNQEIDKFLTRLENYIVSEFIEQGKFTNSLFPLSTNTLRINSFYNPTSKIAFIKQPYLRIGTSKTIPVDNISQGGVFSFVDIESGILQEVFKINPNKRILKLTAHPESNKQIAGKTLPLWDEIKTSILKTAEIIGPLIKIVGWDIVIRDDDFVILEGNNGPDFTQQGLEDPIAFDNEVLAFLKAVNIR